MQDTWSQNTEKYAFPIEKGKKKKKNAATATFSFQKPNGHNIEMNLR